MQDKDMVYADIPNCQRPRAIGGFIPDIIAIKGRLVVILEVETSDSNLRDSRQHQVFQSYANRTLGVIFRKRVI